MMRRDFRPLFASFVLGAVAALAGSASAQVDLTAAFSDDATEDTTGVFQAPNVSPVTPAGFPQLRFLMRPVTLSAPGVQMSLVLSATGDPILQVFTTSGTPVSLPASFDPGDLPLTLLVNATAFGSATLTLGTNAAGGAMSDSVLFRSARQPGLAGTTLDFFPHFEYVTAINEDDVVQTALDPNRHGERVGLDYDVYIVRHRRSDQWAASNLLIDVSGAIETATVTAGGVQDNVVDAWTTNLDGAAGVGLGVAYDVVYDFGMDGTLDPGDLVDGFTFLGNRDDVTSAGGGSFDEAGFYVVRDLTEPGPLATRTETYNGGVFLTQRTVFPEDIADMGKLPLVQISHGNGHSFNWYDYLQQHLASYGYIVMSHSNDTQPGIETASTTTLTNLEFLLGNQDSIEGGVLDGHIDETQIIWIGHSRGGEGVARAYDRIFDGQFVPQNFELSGIQLVSSIAPTDFLGTLSANPHDVPYHLLYGSADGDVCGCPNNDIAQSFHLLERSVGISQSTYVHGADHNDFNCCGFNDFQGPPGTEIGRAEAQRVAKAVYLALVKRYFEENVPALDYLTRQYEALKPPSVADTTTVVSLYKEEGPDAFDTFVIDDFETNGTTNTSSSGGSVTFDVTNLSENRLNDNNTSFTWVASDPFNGMTYARPSDPTRGIVFDWNVDRFLEFQVVEPERDFRDDEFLSFRACQGTRHPNTTALLDDLTFQVTLRDGSGNTSSIDISAYKGGIEEPYQRTGFGIGAGWQNEFETIRIRLTDFVTNGTTLDLGDIVAVRFEFGPSFGDNVGRLGLDDVEIERRPRDGRR